MDAFEILGIPKSATRKQLNTAYRNHRGKTSPVVQRAYAIAHSSFLSPSQSPNPIIKALCEFHYTIEFVEPY
jgi:hypothetical protein